MLDYFKWPGNAPAQTKLNSLVDGHNTMLTFRGDDTFIKVQRGKGYLMVSLNFQEILRRIPKTNSTGAWFTASSLPAAIGGVVPPYFIGHSQSNTSTGSSNVSVGVTSPHAAGDLVFCRTVPFILTSTSTVLKDANSSVITWKEEGAYGPPVECTLSQNGGSNGSAGVASTYTYDIKVGSTTLATSQPVSKPRIIPTTVNAATKGMVYVDPTKSPPWVIQDAYETYGEVTC